MFPAIPNLRDYILASVAPHSFTSLRHSCHPKLTDDDPLMSPDSYQGWTHDKSGCCAEIAYKFTFKNPEPLMRIELTTSSLPRKCSTTELQRLLKSLSQWAIGHWSRFSHWLIDLMTNDNSERKTRFEPATYSLEGCRSTNWATSALLLGKVPLAPDSYRDEIKIVSQFPICLSKFSKKRTVGKDGFEPPNS